LWEIQVRRRYARKTQGNYDRWNRPGTPGIGLCGVAGVFPQHGGPVCLAGRANFTAMFIGAGFIDRVLSAISSGVSDIGPNFAGKLPLTTPS
jgi:hypothetical protein